MIRLAVHVGVIIIYWFAIQNVRTKGISGVDISVTSSAHTTPSQSTPITTTTPRIPTTTPNCLIDGIRYPPNTEVSRGYDASTNWCYGSFVDENCNMMMWDIWNCHSTTTTSTTTTTPGISTSTPQIISTTTTSNPKKRKHKQKKMLRKLKKMKRQKINMIRKMKMQKKWRKQLKKIQLKRKKIKTWKMMMKRKMQRKKLLMKNKVD